MRSLIANAGFTAPPRRVGFILTFASIAVYGLLALRGPQGIQALMDKHREIRQLELDNGALAQQNQAKKERIDRLKNNADEQRLTIREKLKYLAPGETTYMLPGKEKSESSAEAPVQ